MKHNEAKRQLQHALKHQQTISIPKLNMLLQNLNISTSKTVRVIKKRNGRITVIHWNGEDYIWRDKDGR